jgi:hypothetical protein
MAAGILPKPGTKLGPCKAKCQHIDCAETRARATSLCLYCRKPVGYGTPVYFHGDYTVHAICHEVAAESNSTLF